MSLNTTNIKSKLLTVMDILKISGDKILESIIWDVIKEIISIEDKITEHMVWGAIKEINASEEKK